MRMENGFVSIRSFVAIGLAGGDRSERHLRRCIRRNVGGGREFGSARACKLNAAGDRIEPAGVNKRRARSVA